MERRARLIWWGVLGVMLIIAAWKLFLPHGTKAYVDKSANTREIVVYLTGAVEKPGLVRLSLDARLDDALKQVRLLPEANLDAINPAERLKDGQKVSVPFKSVPPAGSASQPGMSSSVGAGASIPSSAIPSNGSQNISANYGSTNSNPQSGNAKININTAGVADLDKLPGIGPALAERIIQYRTENGLFAKPEDLQEVSGIGPKTFEKMANLVTVGP